MSSRPLRAKEKELLEFVLPGESPGYAAYRERIDSMVVLGAGRRGVGNIVLGYEGDVPDNTSPLTPVIAYGVVETTRDLLMISVREFAGDQMDVELVSSADQEIPDHFEEKRRWTYSTWKPGMASPATNAEVRQVQLNNTLIFAVAKEEKRLWLNDAATGINYLIPITNFHNELMLHKAIRDPEIALRSDLFFEKLGEYSDEDLRGAFVAYNRIHRKVSLSVEPVPQTETGFKTLISRLFKSRTT